MKISTLIGIGVARVLAACPSFAQPPFQNPIITGMNPDPSICRADNNPLMGADASGGQYAATIRHHDGVFDVIGTHYGGKGTQGVFYVTATHPAGSWSKPHWLGYWYVDPSLLFVDNAVYYNESNIS